MRIAYLGQMADIATENGISKKIRTQALHWSNAGHAVRYFSLVPTNAAWSGLAPLEVELQTRGRFGWRILQSLRLAHRVRAWRPDVIYFRYAYHSAGFPGLFREIPTVAEINSDDLAEYPLTLSAAKLAYHRLTRRRVLGAVSAFVPVTHELAARFAEFGHPAEVIANGIDLEAFVPTPPTDATNPPRLIFVGSAGTPWHGLERVAELVEICPGFTIDIIGCTAADCPRPTATALPAALRFHGPLTRTQYEPLIRTATAAIGTMALFRKRMDEACPLKVREYLALGLPVIAAYADTDIAESADYFLRLPNNATSLAAERTRILAFIDHWRGRRVPRSAVAHLDTGVKERQRLAFLARLAQKRVV